MVLTNEISKILFGKNTREAVEEIYDNRDTKYPFDILYEDGRSDERYLIGKKLQDVSSEDGGMLDSMEYSFNDVIAIPIIKEFIMKTGVEPKFFFGTRGS
jgi:hypothetical protein